MRFALASLLALLFVSPGRAAAAEVEAARKPIEALYAVLVECLRNADALGLEGRRAKIAPAVAASYDLPFMAELILGRQWKSLSADQQKRWLETFTKLTVSTYADRFDAYAGERFEVGAVEPATQGTSMVRTQLVRTDDEPVKLDYRMRQNAGHWRIIDVYLSGTVSELALRRSEYSALMRKEGFDALLTAVGKKIAAHEAGTSEEADAP